MTFVQPPPPKWLTRIVRLEATLCRKGGGYQVDRYKTFESGGGSLGYKPLWFPKGELRTAIGYAEMSAGLLSDWDPDARPRWIFQTHEMEASA